MSFFNYAHRCSVLVVILASTAPASPAAEKTTEKPSIDLLVAPLPALEKYAATEKIPLGPLAMTADLEARTGDTLVSLVTLCEGDRYRQWLVQATVVPPNDSEQKKIARESAEKVADYYSLLGTKISFDLSQAILEVRTIGPFASDDTKPRTPPDRRARTPISVGLIRPGLDSFALGIHRVRLAATPDATASHRNLKYQFDTKPFPPEAVRAARAIAQDFNLTPENEKGILHGPCVLLSFFEVAQNTPGMKEILGEMLNRTSLGFSAILRAGNLKPDVNPVIAGMGQRVETNLWGPAMPPIYRGPIEISLAGKKALTSELWVTRPYAPLLNAAGILAVIVSSEAYPEKTLFIRVLSGGRNDTNTKTTR